MDYSTNIDYELDDTGGGLSPESSSSDSYNKEDQDAPQAYDQDQQYDEQYDDEDEDVDEDGSEYDEASEDDEDEDDDEDDEEEDDQEPEPEAPSFKIPSRSMAAVEHPFLIMNVDKGIETFGNNPQFPAVRI